VWTAPLPSSVCPDSLPNCHYASPVISDIDNDEFGEIIVATNKGHVIAFNHDGSVVWNVDLAPAFGMATGTQQITSSPAVADIDADGRAEIVVATGTILSNICTQGGIIVLEHNGAVKPGWPVFADDHAVAPAGCADTIFSTPALTDLDGDGYLEIITGGFDKRIRVYHHNAQPVDGFPPDSHLSAAFPTWTDLRQRLGDTIWSSPAVGLLDGDERLDIIIGTDEGYLNSLGGWNCPYTLPAGWAEGYCGGSLYGLTSSGARLAGNFPRYFYETVGSTPALADVTGDGRPEIFLGTGTFYYNHSPDHPTNGFRVYGLDHRGNDLPGWTGGKVVGGTVPASPSVGDITGDGNPEIVVATSGPERKLYAWHSDGRLVAGFPMQPVDHYGKANADFNVGTGFVLADTDGDATNEIVFNQGWTVTIVDGTGRQLTSPRFPATDRPIYLTDGMLLNTPAVGDIDNDGKLELVTHNSRLYVWELPQSTSKTAWPMFRHNPARTGNNAPAYLKVAPVPATALVERNSGTIEMPIHVKSVGGAAVFEWRAEAQTSPTAQLPLTAGTATNEVTIFLEVATDHLRLGSNDLGTVEIMASIEGEPISGSPTSVPVVVVVAENLYTVSLPVLQR
ncbi:MAG: VCBS repeat-containing protein, partial [Anaerolineae bacterium]|nr:VCBS repeat-containing protein [Anaerolineae bacterium]